MREVWIHKPRDRGLEAAASVRHLSLWHYKPRSNELPRIAPNLEELVVTTSGSLVNHSALTALPHLRFARHDGRDLIAGTGG